MTDTESPVDRTWPGRPTLLALLIALALAVLLRVLWPLPDTTQPAPERPAASEQRAAP
ncbi:hypothetical protein [Streptomyces sp. NPDC049879]|uniref:hypothetical protein n=1 Tax=Streptomyces sp. NPDC049879 TaxID=3365598 RepID=UPI003798A2EC